MRGFEILKVGRRVRGLTQLEVAEAYGVGIRTYQRWERGQTLVSYDDLAGICGQVFRISLEEFQGGGFR